MKPQTLRNSSFITLLVIVTLVFLALIGGFLMPVFWAAVLAGVFTPIFKRLNRRLRGRRSLAAALTVLIVVLILVIPLTLVGFAVANETIALYTRISSGEIDIQAPITRLQQMLPALTRLLDRVGVEPERLQQGVSGAAVTASRYLASQIVTIGSNAAQFTLLFFLMLYLLFFFIKDGEDLLETIIRALPLGDVRERILLTRFAAVSKATLKGTIIVGAVQGAIGGILFWLLGIRAPVFWGVLMALFSFLPAVGPAAIWVPAALILLLTGHFVKGIILIVAGILIIGLVDNLLRPILVGRDTEMPDYLVLLATLGGIALFGISGFIIGPIIAALFLTVWDMFAEEFGAHDDHPAR